VLAKLGERGYSSSGARSPMLAKQIAAMAARPDSKEFLSRPERSIRAGDARARRGDSEGLDVVSGGAHFRGHRSHAHVWPRAENVHIINEFGAIGSAFAIAIGVAAARGDGKVLLIEGDGSLMMHIQELETIRRHGIRMLICAVNDGGYGAEVHKFRANGYDPQESQHGRGDIAAIARGFGLGGEKITTSRPLRGSLRCARENASTPSCGTCTWDDKIPSAPYRRIHFGEV
jgi:thiamine pyrophosphate-dependent acetolactate synthase large subunit-like protein